MLIGHIRPVESRTFEATGESLATLHTAVEAQLLQGWEITDMPAAMPKGSSMVTTTATIARRDGIREIEADTMPQLEALVPDGWQLLSVRAL